MSCVPLAAAHELLASIISPCGGDAWIQLDTALFSYYMATMAMLATQSSDLWMCVCLWIELRLAVYRCGLLVFRITYGMLELLLIISLR